MDSLKALELAQPASAVLPLKPKRPSTCNTDNTFGFKWVQSLAKPASSLYSLIVSVLDPFAGVAADAMYPAMLACTEPISAFATPSLVHP